ncbi:hypothetical protein RNJ44_00192 [Nakaseomyces bracarensis]|uniref:Major facilitator superfamily (MFS) profile domain-containing protein n=1 Tax=Nakaseomyces bracarensis TaxID=273131 RepID=A0ABR4NT66_9SACH
MIDLTVVALKRHIFSRKKESVHFENNSPGVGPQEHFKDDSNSDNSLKNLKISYKKSNGDNIDEDVSVANTGFELDEHSQAKNSLTRERTVAIEEDQDEELYGLDNDKEFPDGGLRAWSVVFGSFMGLIPVFGVINSLGAIESYISTHQLVNVSSSTTSWIFSIYLTMSFLTCIFAGGYFDRNGSMDLMIVGTCFYVGGIFGMADCKEIYQFILSFSILCGTGTGI